MDNLYQNSPPSLPRSQQKWVAKTDNQRGGDYACMLWWNLPLWSDFVRRTRWCFLVPIPSEHWVSLEERIHRILHGSFWTWEWTNGLSCCHGIMFCGKYRMVFFPWASIIAPKPCELRTDAIVVMHLDFIQSCLLQIVNTATLHANTFVHSKDRNLTPLWPGFITNKHSNQFWETGCPTCRHTPLIYVSKTTSSFRPRVNSILSSHPSMQPQIERSTTSLSETSKGRGRPSKNHLKQTWPLEVTGL